MIRQLPVKLTDAELRLRRENVVRILGEIDLQKEHFAKLKADEKAQLGDLKEHLDETLKSVRERSELRPIECEERQVFEQNAIHIIRTDTGDIVEERPMDVADRQLQLDAEVDDAGDS